MDVPSKYLFLSTLAILTGTFLISSVPDAYAQTIIGVNETTPCFLNYTAGVELWRNCGADDDYLQWAMQPFEYITGGNFSLVLVSVFVVFTYVKYQKMVYPIIVGVLFLPISYFVFPDVFLSFSIVMAFIGVGILIWYTFIKQTKEY